MSDDRFFDSTIRASVPPSFLLQTLGRPDIFLQIQGPGSPRKILLTKPRIVIGRSTEADVQIPSTMVSRQHIELLRIGHDLVCRDLESHNGLFLNGVQVYSVELREGDTLQIGDVIFVYHQGVQWTAS